jgi:cold shock protein
MLLPATCWRSGMNRAPDRLWRRVVVVLCRLTYGFRPCADGPDVFVHCSEIDGYGFRSLTNQYAEFEVTHGSRGLEATHVRAA